MKAALFSLNKQFGGILRENMHIFIKHVPYVIRLSNLVTVAFQYDISRKRS